MAKENKALGREVGFCNPGLSSVLDNFLSKDVLPRTSLDGKTRGIAIISVLAGSQSAEYFKEALPSIMEGGVTADEVYETLYQAVAYLGIGRAYPFLKYADEVLGGNGREYTSATDAAERLDRGEKAQIEIFGAQMKGFAASGDAMTGHINEWLVKNCFGDYYTRGVLGYAQREMITFCLLAAQGGCEPQLKSHTAANIRIGNDAAFLTDVISQCMPYIGYPRTLNALAAIKEVSAK